jgi:hypothetical protein
MSADRPVPTPADLGDFGPGRDGGGSLRRRVLGLTPLSWLLLSCLLSFGIWLGRSALREARADDRFRFDPRCVDIDSQLPVWFDRAQARSFFEQYLGLAGEPFSLIEDEAFAAWLERVRDLPWVLGLHAERRLPDQVQLAFDLRRPRIYAQGPGRWISWVAEDGMLLPLLASHVQSGERERALWDELESGGAPFAVPAAGSEIPAPSPGTLPLLLGIGEVLPGEEGVLRRSGVARIARTWAEELEPALRAKSRESAWAPQLYGVDASNAAWQISRAKARHRLVLRSQDGRAVLAAWGHEPGARYEQIPSAEKLAVLLQILRSYPGLVGLHSLDLRFPQTWEQRLVLDPVLAAQRESEAGPGGSLGSGSSRRQDRDSGGGLRPLRQPVERGRSSR